MYGWHRSRNESSTDPVIRFSVDARSLRVSGSTARKMEGMFNEFFEEGR